MTIGPGFLTHVLTRNQNSKILVFPTFIEFENHLILSFPFLEVPLQPLGLRVDGDLCTKGRGRSLGLMCFSLGLDYLPVRLIAHVVQLGVMSIHKAKPHVSLRALWQVSCCS